MAYLADIDRGETFQYYSEKAWSTSREDFADGEFRASADLRWVKRIFLADSVAQRSVFGRSFSSERNTLKQLQMCSWLVVAATTACAYLAFQLYGLGAMLVLAYVLNVYWNSVSHNPKAWGVMVIIFGFVAMSLGVFWGKSFLMGFCLCTGLCFAWPHFYYWFIERATLRLLMNDYQFFKIMTGRAKDCNERPPVVLTLPTAKGFRGLPWDVNDEPALRDFQVLSGHPVITGRTFDYYLSIPDCRLLAVAFGCFLAYVTKLQGNYLAYVLLYSVCISLLNAFICPSQHFAEFRRWVISKEWNGDHCMVAIVWFFYNIVWTSLCLMAVGLGFHYIWPYFVQLVDSVSKWRQRH